MNSKFSPFNNYYKYFHLYNKYMNEHVCMGIIFFFTFAVYKKYSQTVIRQIRSSMQNNSMQLSTVRRWYANNEIVTHRKWLLLWILSNLSCLINCNVHSSSQIIHCWRSTFKMLHLAYVFFFLKEELLINEISLIKFIAFYKNYNNKKRLIQTLNFKGIYIPKPQ